MNEPEDTPIVPPAEAAQDKPKPARKRAPKVKPLEEGAAPSNAPSELSVAPEAQEPVVKTPRKRRTAQAADEASTESVEVSDDTLGESSASAGDEEAPAKPARRKRAPKAESVSTDDAGATASRPANVQAELPLSTAGELEHARAEAPQAERQVAAGGAQPESGDEEAFEGAEAGEGEDSAAGISRPSRNRRRNRKERQRERAALAAAQGVVGEQTASAVVPDAGDVFAHVMSSEFDVEEAAADDAEQDGAEEDATKRVLQPDPDAPKLHKVLAQAGIGSRRDMEELILEGKITVNDQPAHVGQRISFGDQIKVDGKPVRVRIVPPPPRIIAYHKPVGEVVTHDDPQSRPTVFRRLPRLPQGKWQSVGRLDLNTEGLLLFTNSGDLANQLMHPRFGVEREYAVRVLGMLSNDDKARLLEGVDVDGQAASFKSIVDGGGEGANHWYRVVITEGRNREVRKLLDAVGLTVSRLIRIRYGTVVLPRGLKRGVWVDLEEGDVRAIRRLAGGGGAPRGDVNRQDNRQGDNRGNARNNNAKGQQRNNNDRQGNRNDRGPRPNRPPGNQQGQQGHVQPPRDDAFRDDDDFDLDFDPSKIPNPLEQTFDKRFVQKPRGPAGGAGFGRGGGGFGAGGSAPLRPAKKSGGPREPDPLQTSVGYIGADAFHRRGNKGGGGGNRGGKGGSGGGGGGGFGKGGGRRGR